MPLNTWWVYQKGTIIVLIGPRKRTSTNELKVQKYRFGLNNNSPCWPQKSINIELERRNLPKIGKVNLRDLGMLNELLTKVEELIWSMTPNHAD